MKHESSPKFDLHERVYIEPTAWCEGFQTQIVGLEESRWLILEHPFSDSWLHRLKPKDLIWGRYFKGTAIRFMTKVINTIENPIPLIFIEYPSVVEASNRRESERKKTFIDCQVCDPRSHHSRHSWQGYILDISKSGCLILGGFVNLLDRDILLSFRLPFVGIDIRAKAQVVRCEVSKKGIETGIKFTDLDPESRDSIQRYVESLDVQQDERIHENPSQQHSVETSRPGEKKCQSPKSQSAKPERAKAANQGLDPLGTPLKKIRLRKLEGKRDSRFSLGAEILGRATVQPKPGKPFFIDLDSGRVLRTSKVKEYVGDRLRTKHSVYAIEVLDEFLNAKAGSPQVTVV